MPRGGSFLLKGKSVGGRTDGTAVYRLPLRSESLNACHKREKGIYMQYTLFGAIDIGSSEMELKDFLSFQGKRHAGGIDCIQEQIWSWEGKTPTPPGRSARRSSRGALPRAERFHLHHEKLQGGRPPGQPHHECDQEAKNRVILLDYLEKKTGLKIRNCSTMPSSVSWIQSPSQLRPTGSTGSSKKAPPSLDVGGGSVQVSFLTKDSLVPPEYRIRTSVSASGWPPWSICTAISRSWFRADEASFKFQENVCEGPRGFNVILVGDYLGGLSKNLICFSGGISDDL